MIGARKARRPIGRPSRILVYAALGLVPLAAPATTEPVILDPGEWNRRLAARGVETPDLPYPLDVSDALRAAAEEHAGQGKPINKLENLQRYLFDPDKFFFDYEDRVTLTAAEAFDRGGGNCVSFTNMFIAMGRAVGIPVQAALAYGPEGSQRVDDLVVVDSHVVAAYRHSRGKAIYDFQQQREIALVGYELLDDYWLMAIYLNNHAVELILDDRVEEAQVFIKDALRLAPDFVDAYNNLGVSYRRLGQTEKALDAYLLALRLEPGNRSIQHNLRPLFAIMSEERNAGIDPETISEFDRLIADGDVELSHGAVVNAKKLYQRAIDLEPDRPEPHVSIARAQLYRGQLRDAKKSLKRALALDPDNPEARRLHEALTAE
jgi:tetratricopeptide (TPR) repeat protein